VVASVKDSVVTITSEGESTRGLFQIPSTGVGSGIILTSDGYILTNKHVVAGGNSFTVELNDEEQFTGQVVEESQTTDLALMKIDAHGLKPAVIGDASKLQVGETTIAIGSPLGTFTESVTKGILSATGRTITVQDEQTGRPVTLTGLLQTDAAINPGNSGGPLLNLRGELVGINTAIASTSGANEAIGFAIPINMVMVVANQLVEHGAVIRSYLGVRLDSSFGPEAAAKLGLPTPQGARVSGITRNSPAEQARILVGDIILEFDGTRIDNDAHLINLVSLTPVNKEVAVRIFRDGRPVSLRLRVANRAQMPSE